MKVAAVQFKATDDKRRNIARAIACVEEAARHHAKFIALPEIFVWRGVVEGKVTFQNIGETVPGPTTKMFCDLARKRKVNILMGSLYEKINGEKKVFNTSVFINKKGDIAAKYRKINLFDARFGDKKIKESMTFLAGNKPALARVEGFTAGLSICYDLRFPSMYQRYKNAGADILCIPSAFTRQTGKFHWTILLKARAIENLCYVIAPNQVGTDKKGVTSFGHSMIVSPWGNILAEASGSREEIIYADIEKKTLEQDRKILPMIKGGV